MRKILPLLLLAVGAAFIAPMSSGPADAAQVTAAEAEAQFLASLNSTRAAAGLPALVVHSELTGLSRGWAQAMADAGAISHASPISGGLTAPWLKLGENVGTGGEVQAVMDAFIASPGHYANIVDPEFTHVGVGVVWVGPQLYTTHRFMKLQDTPAETVAPEPEPVAPIPSPTPTTTAVPNPAPVDEPPPTTAPAPLPRPQADVEHVTTLLEALRSITI